MTNELKPCPFCGGRAVLDEYACGEMNITVEHADDCWLTEYEGVFDVLMTEKSAYVEAWNTRAERTCHNKARYGNFKCDVCNAFLQLTDFDEEPMLTVDGVGYIPSYCPNCGAKVVD